VGSINRAQMRWQVSFAAVSLILAAGLMSVPAHAATTSVSGSLTCPAGKEVWVSVNLAERKTADYYKGTRLVRTSSAGYDHVHDYNARTVTWTVKSTGGITYQSDYCVASGATLLAD
jgi:hypothetical protein